MGFRRDYSRSVQAERQSQTAFGVALARAVEHAEPEGRRILEDPYAVEFVRDAAGRVLATRLGLAFDYVPPSVVDGAARIGTWRAARAGEPFLFGVELPELDALLARHGFARVEHLGPDEMVARYATPRRRMIDFAYLVTARREEGHG